MTPHSPLRRRDFPVLCTTVSWDLYQRAHRVAMAHGLTMNRFLRNLLEKELDHAHHATDCRKS